MEYLLTFFCPFFWCDHMQACCICEWHIQLSCICKWYMQLSAIAYATELHMLLSHLCNSVAYAIQWHMLLSCISNTSTQQYLRNNQICGSVGEYSSNVIRSDNFIFSFLYFFACSDVYNWFWYHTGWDIQLSYLCCMFVQVTSDFDIGMSGIYYCGNWVFFTTGFDIVLGGIYNWVICVVCLCRLLLISI
jgi:hypothetical protein